jgi:septum formation protein
VQLVLASRSPQRRALLSQLAIPFRVEVSGYEEELTDGRPRRTVAENARGKAEDVRAGCKVGPHELVLGVDTVVVVDGAVLGKAGDQAEARAYLRRLADRSHEVYSGLHLCSATRGVTVTAVTKVTFRELSDAALEAYVACGEWRERAGAYAIQGIGSALVTGVEGDYFNVVGLPVAALLEALDEFGVPPFSWLQENGGTS